MQCCFRICAKWGDLEGSINCIFFGTTNLPENDTYRGSSLGFETDLGCVLLKSAYKKYKLLQTLPQCIPKKRYHRQEVRWALREGEKPALNAPRAELTCPSIFHPLTLLWFRISFTALSLSLSLFIQHSQSCNLSHPFTLPGATALSLSLCVSKCMWTLNDNVSTCA